MVRVKQKSVLNIGILVNLYFVDMANFIIIGRSAHRALVGF